MVSTAFGSGPSAHPLNGITKAATSMKRLTDFILPAPRMTEGTLFACPPANQNDPTKINA
jgi:hypothetical protein